MKTVTTLVEPTKDNINALFTKINKYAEEKGYRITGNTLSLPTNLIGMEKSPKFESKKKMKVVRNYMTKLDKKITMGTCNRFLHVLFKHVYESKAAPRIDYSEKECQIQAARKAWKKADIEAMKLQKIYKETKGTFYKK